MERPPTNSLNASGKIDIGGGTTISSGSSVTSGGNLTTGTNVNANSLNAGGKINIGGGTTISSGSAVIAGGNLTTGTNTHLTGVDVTVGGTATYGGGTTGPATSATGVSPAPFSGLSIYQLPTLPTLPADSIAAPSGGANMTVGTNQTTNLGPGNYGAVSLGGGGALNLTAGGYHFKSITVGSNFNINYDLSGGPINIYVDGDANMSGGTHWNLSSGDASDVYWELNGDFTAGTNTRIYGTIFTANGGVANLGDDQDLGGGGLFVGQFLATGGIRTGTNTEFSLLLNDRFTSAENVIGATPIPTTLPLFGTGLGIIGLLGWRRKRKAAARAV